MKFDGKPMEFQGHTFSAHQFTFPLFPQFPLFWE